MQLFNTLPAIVQCPKCLKWWKPGNLMCAIFHIGDGCCHYSDEEVPAPEWAP